MTSLSEILSEKKKKRKKEGKKKKKGVFHELLQLKKKTKNKFDIFGQ
jgi:hypothetical protein